MATIPDETSIAVAARNEIVRLTGECTLPLLVIHKAIQEAERVRTKLSEQKQD